MCDKRDKAISYVFCRDLHLTSMFSGLLQKDLFKGRWILAKSYFKQNYCHACHTRFAVFFPLPSCCVSSLMTTATATRTGKKATGFWLAKRQLCTCITFFLYDYNVKVPNFMFGRRRKLKTRTFFFFSWTLIQSFRIQLKVKFANIWRIERVGISARKFEGARIRFLSDVFLVVA